MRSDLLLLALVVGAFTYGFRFLPIRGDLSRLLGRGILGRFMTATGPAAIATLLAASLLPLAREGAPLPLLGGLCAVLAAYWRLRSAVLATLIGAAAYGLFVALV